MPTASQDSSKPVKWFAQATSEEDAKKKWGAIWSKAKRQQAEDMAEKYKEYRVGNTRMIRPPLEKGKAIWHSLLHVSVSCKNIILFSFSGTVMVMVLCLSVIFKCDAYLLTVIRIIHYSSM